MLVWISDETTTFEIKATIPLRFQSSLITLLAETCQNCATRLEFWFCSFSRFGRRCGCAELVSSVTTRKRISPEKLTICGKTTLADTHSEAQPTVWNTFVNDLSEPHRCRLSKNFTSRSEGNCDTCKSFIKRTPTKIRQHFQQFLLSSLTLRRVIFAVNGLLGAPFANFVQKRASYSTFTYIPKSVFPCWLKLVSEETGIAACKTKI